MSTTPMVEPLQQWSPPMPVIQQGYTAQSGHGSIGPVIGVLVVITFLGVLSGMMDRICSGRRRFMGLTHNYDLEAWVERKFSSCLDGRVDPQPLPPPAEAETAGGGGSAGGDAVPVAATVEAAQEKKVEEEITKERPNESAAAKA